MDIILFPPISFFLVLTFTHVIYKIAFPPVQAPQHFDKETEMEKRAGMRENKFFVFAAFFALFYAASFIVATWAFYSSARSIVPLVAYVVSLTVALFAIIMD